MSPSVPSRPVPAPRQFQSFTNINILSPAFQGSRYRFLNDDNK